MRRVLWETVLNTWRSVQGLARRLMCHSHCNPSQAEPNRTESYCLSSAQFYGRSVYTSWHPDSLMRFDRSAALSKRPVASLSSWGLSYFRRIILVASRSLRDNIKYTTFCAGIGQTSCVIRTATRVKPSRAEQNRTEPNRTAWIPRSSTDAPVIPLHIS